MAELKALGEKPELEEAVQVLEERSRGWFESEELFVWRLRGCGCGQTQRVKQWFHDCGRQGPQGKSQIFRPIHQECFFCIGLRRLFSASSVKPSRVECTASCNQARV